MVTSVPRKPRVFIGSAAEHVRLAEAVQRNFDREVEPTIWSQDVFEPSSYPLEVLINRLEVAEFGVFILAPTDLTISRHRRVASPRDNVVLELGMFFGRFGRNRTFFVVPRGHATKFPTDLTGLIAGEYDADRQDGNLVAAVAPACRQMLERVKKDFVATKQGTGLIDARIWTDYHDRMDALIRSSKKQITVFFIHSRSWRDRYANAINDFLSQAGSQLTVFLPDPADAVLLATISAHFDDGAGMPAFISDGCRHFGTLATEWPDKVVVRFFQRYPVYSAYLLDERSILALYPNAQLRQPVPAFEITYEGSFGAFLLRDLGEIEAHESRIASIEELKALSVLNSEGH